MCIICLSLILLKIPNECLNLKQYSKIFYKSFIDFIYKSSTLLIFVKLDSSINYSFYYIYASLNSYVRDSAGFVYIDPRSLI